ncbi:MAG: endopeptidase La [Myxococcota bacterium]|nr:endopeptidase La [Myxococcota bacterium]
MSEFSCPSDMPTEFPVVPMRESVVFPHMVLPASALGEAAAHPALNESEWVLLLAQRHPQVTDPEVGDLCCVGTLAWVVRSGTELSGPRRILVQGVGVAQVEAFVETSTGLHARVEIWDSHEGAQWSPEVESLMRSLRAKFEELVPLRGLPREILPIVANTEDPGHLANVVASNLCLEVSEAQAILEVRDPVSRLRKVDSTARSALDRTIEEAEKACEGSMRDDREAFLREQLRAIQDELQEENAHPDEVTDYRRRIDDVQPTDACREEALRQLARLQKMHSESPEAQVVRNYLDWITELPWNVLSEDCGDLDRARKVLDTDHAHLETVKTRLLEFLGVRKLRGDTRGPILCFSGPPGVGKTSLGRSIARAMGREFVRISLGGVRDEAEIRGHRRTYVGAMPGRILQSLKQAGTRNPVVLLDEIDKVGTDHRGDPAAALLEVLDPEQNGSFVDHFINAPFDLSQVLFIATANRLEPIPAPLRDRMELIPLPGYSAEEKAVIAERFLVPRQLEEHGLVAGQVHWSNRSLSQVITDYTSEAGVRGLERQIAVVCRKVAFRAAEGDSTPVRVTQRNLARYLGVPPYVREAVSTENEVGVSRGLAWTESGGELLTVEASVISGSGLVLTGQLGDVMKESGRTALSFARSILLDFDPTNEILGRNEVHVHVPAGAIPKDGPSAGIAIAASLISVALRNPVRSDVAMTGEITLRGRVLPVGGVREKALAALRNGITTVILPEANMRDLEEIPREQKNRIEFVPVTHMREVVDAVLERPVPKQAPLRWPARVPAPGSAMLPVSAEGS